MEKLRHLFTKRPYFFRFRGVFVTLQAQLAYCVHTLTLHVTLQARLA
jgi:hypothetical protein